MDYLVVFILVNFLILVHELGHFIAAKLLGIPTERFSIGFGPKLWNFRKGQTEYRLSAFPVGGYVLPKVENEDDFYQIDSSRRIAFALGGPLANILIPVICLGILNITTKGFTFSGILLYPFVEMAKMTYQFLSMLPGLFSRPEQLSGIIGIIAVGGQFLAGDLLKLLELAIILNINFAVLNLLPIPPFDGGKIALCLLEKVHSSLVKLDVPLTVTGWVLILGLILYVTIVDVHKYIL